MSKLKGQSKSEEHRKKISESCKGLIKEKNKLKSCKIVHQYDINYNLIHEYPSIMEASRKTGIAQPNISACCNGRLHSAGGYYWSF